MSSKADLGGLRKTLREGWHFKRFAAGSHSAPDSLPEARDGWHPATVPCTVASALRDLGSADTNAVEDLDDSDQWFHCSFEAGEFAGKTTELVFYGLATISEIWLNDENLGAVENMFVRSEFDVTHRLRSRNDLWICFRSLTPRLQKGGPRARWRTRLVSERNLRFIRTTLLGRMASWCPAIAPVGPWRAVELVSKEADEISCDGVSLRSSYDAELGLGRVEAAIDLSVGSGGLIEAGVWLEIAGVRSPLQCSLGESGNVRATAAFDIEGVEAWWPHTHGSPRRYPVTLHVEMGNQSRQFELDPIGFRRIALLGPPGPEFAIEVNGEAIFCRGTCWTPVDPLALNCSTEAMRGALEQVRDAGMNMLRVSGTTVYEQDDFYQICDELGILIWQEFMFATLDYPSDPDFLSSVRTEVEQFLERVAGRACLAVLCGNSEGQQQPAMLGLGTESWASAIFDGLLPELCGALRADIPYWPSTPSGGDPPFRPDQGTSHYFGVGAYRRPLSDALLARPQFITECLALSNVPGESGADTTPPSRIPQDVGTDWDFKDITNHYLGVYFGEQVKTTALEDSELAAALSRATSARIMEETGTLWRDPLSSCQGALIWLHRDPWACAGWGIIGADGRAKSAYFGLKRAWAPIALALVDEGLNGLRLLAFNDREDELNGLLDLRLLRFDGTLIHETRRALEIPANSTYAMTIEGLLGEFVDSSHAYRFGPRSFDLCAADLTLESGDAIETLHLPIGAGLLPKQSIGLRLQWEDADEEGATLSVSTEHFAQTVVLDLRNGTPSDNFFHVRPKGRKRVRITIEDMRRPVSGSVSALNAEEVVEIPTASDTAS